MSSDVPDARRTRQRLQVVLGAVAVVAIAGVAVAVANGGGSDTSRANVSAQTPTAEPTTEPPLPPSSSPSRRPEDDRALALCREKFPTTVTGRADTVGEARSSHGPRPVQATPSPSVFPGLPDDSPASLCLVAMESSGFDSVYVLSEQTGEAVVVWQQPTGSDEIFVPI